MGLPLQPRHLSEVKDFRNIGARRKQAGPQEEGNQPSTWDRVRKGINILGTAAFVGLTVYNLYVIGGWLSDWYAKRRGDKSDRGKWKRLHPRDWQSTDV